jgi:phosphoglycolate phosphatase
VLGTFGLPALPVPTIVGFVGNGVSKLVERCLVAAGGDAAGARLDQALARFVAYYGEHLLDRTRLYSGIVEAIADLRARGVLLTVATNKHEAMARAILSGLGIAGEFSAVLGGDSVPIHKPDPTIVHELVRRTGVTAAATMLIGDSLVDVATARAARIAVCAVTWGLTAPDTLRDAAPDYIVDRPDQLLSFAS